jgi:tRNA threonylcarbamoyladenosine biosynthesis protein TsaB
MQRSLAIETSGRIGSIALVEDGNLRLEEQFPHGLQHAAQIVPMIDRLCATANCAPRELEHLYVSAGPGSFTGLRIGITLAKTLSFATGAKIVAVPSVRVLVENAPSDAKHVIIVLDAKREQIFTARFERSSDGWVERETAHLDSLSAMLERSPRPVHLLGEGVPYHEKFIPRDEQIITTPSETWRARAGAVAVLGMELAQQRVFEDPFRLTPIYIRRPEAEEKWEQMGKS